MNQFASQVFEKFSDEINFYPSFIDRDSLQAHQLFDTELDRYSNVSIDSSSSFSFDSSEYFNYAICAKKDEYLRAQPLGDPWVHHGRDMWCNPESPQSSWQSGDEMSEFIPFDESIMLSPQITMDKDDELYLAELLHQDMISSKLGWCYPKANEDHHINYGTSHGISGNVLTTQNYPKNNPQDIVRPFSESLYEDKMFNLNRERTSVQYNPNSNEILPNPNNRRNNSEKCLTNGDRHAVSAQTKKGKEGSNNLVQKTKAKHKKEKSTDDDAQRVFLGGLPIGITERMLRQHLAEMGYKVLKRPKILHGFAPEVWMKTVDQAKDLINKGVIMIEGLEVEVRPYNSLTKLSELKKLPNVGKRSVFIGGLSPGTTTKNVQDVLEALGAKVLNYPVIKHGFARQIILDTISQAKALIKMRKIKINGTFADVRPFVNQRRRKNLNQKTIEN